ncbi:LAMI_0G12816g1_1 [Lachancea mirantina]|uniref:LAMI_0G12816g1_1 n=1 Tax=Lachancea mirantina TaxID=1230905 RepID=A0A1G4KBJ0_9SACH|nr:LAMI_0G12816g1_1 [Lachancea mirantina]
MAGTRGRRRSTRVDYKEKQENNLEADVIDSSSSEEESPESKPVWLNDEYVDEKSDVELSSDDENDDGLVNELIDQTAESRKQSQAEDEIDDESVDDSTVSLKLSKLHEFVKQSQVYSGIIAENLLQRTQEATDAVKSQDGENPPPRKKKKITDFFGKKAETRSEDQSQNLAHGQPQLLKNCSLKLYQLEGVNWLITLYENGLNGILADEMGLGKTLQSIALLAFIYEMDTRGPFLIAAPLSTVGHWVNEFQRYAPDIPVLKYYNTQGQGERQSMIKKFFRKTGNEGVVITSYEIIIRDIDLILSHQWKFLVVDEGHRLKNINCKLIRELKRINTSNRLLLTGTPLQNNLAELWSLLNFILPEIFADFEIFNKWFDFGDDDLKSSSSGLNKIINAELEKNLVSNLHTILKPFLLRRLKSVVLADVLPPKREYIVNCPLTKTQRKFYKAALGGKLKQAVFKQAVKDFFTLNSSHIGNVSHRSIRDYIEYKLTSKDQDSASDILKQMDELYEQNVHRELRNKRLQNMMMQLRQIVDSTLLFFFPYMNAEDMTLKQLLKVSGKLQILQQLVPNLIQKGHKVLIFTQFVTMLDLLQDWCELNDFAACRLDGSMNNEERQEQINLFNDKKRSYSVFLISTRAGGLGINVSSADSVIIFDSDWNPQVDLQAMDRAHRIGQSKPVIVYRLCCDKTVEHVVLTRAAGKRNLEKMVIQMGNFTTLKKMAKGERGLANIPGATSSSSSNKELVNELSQLLLTGSSSLDFQGQKDEGKLTDAELEELTDRSQKAYRLDRDLSQHPHIKLFESSSKLE